MSPKKRLAVVALITLIVSSLMPFSHSAVAAEVQDPLIKEWLDIVGEHPESDVKWEKEWVGKTIDANNVDMVKDLIPAITYEVVKTLGGTFSIEPAKIDFRPSPGWIKATKDNMGKARIGDQMALLDYIGGCPFPRPGDDPLKIAWNRDRGTYEGDDFIYRKVRFHVYDMEGKGRTTGVDYARLKYGYRSDIDPVPEFPGNPGIYRSTKYTVTSPFDLKDLTLMVVKYKDSTKQDDVWIYVPTMRRVRRMSAGQRCDSMAATDLAWEDADLYDGEVRVNEYKFIAKRDFLLPHTVYPYPESMKLKGFWVNGVPYSKRPCYIMEANSTIPDFCYSKRIWYVDTVSSRLYITTLYDRKGNLWKEHTTGINRTKPDPNSPKGAVNNPNMINYVDIIARHGSPWLYDAEKPGEPAGPYVNNNFKADEFSVEGIKKGVH